MGWRSFCKPWKKIDLIVQSFNLFKIIKVLNKEFFFKKYFKSFNTEQLKFSHYTFAISALPRHLFEIYGAIFLSLFLVFAFRQDFSNQEILAISSIFLLVLLRLLPATSRIVQSSTRLNLYKSIHQINSKSKEIHFSSKVRPSGACLYSFAGQN